ncbi:MAG: hypothetical protein ACRC0L_08055, partial [Angustibacter sp.]
MKFLTHRPWCYVLIVGPFAALLACAGPQVPLAEQSPVIFQQSGTSGADAVAAVRALEGVMASGSAADVAAFNVVAGRRATDQLYHIEFVRAMGVAKLVAFGEFLRDHGGRFENPETGANLRVETAKNVGVSIVRAGNEGYDRALPVGGAQRVRGWRAGYYAQLKAVGRTRYSADAMGGLRPDSSGLLHGYHILGEYFYAAGATGARAGLSFAADVGVDMASWDREGIEDGRAWSARGSQVQLGQHSMVGPDTPGSVDAISGLLATLRGDRPAAQKVLLHPLDTGAGKTEAVLTHLLSPQRTANIPTGLDPEYGRQLGEAIYSASGDATDQQSTRVAHDALNHYARYVGQRGRKTLGPSLAGNNQHRRSGGGSTYGDERPGLRRPMAQTFAHHIADFQEHDSKNGPVYVGDQPPWVRQDGEKLHHVFLTKKQYEALLREFPRDRPGDLAELDPRNPNAMQIVLGAQMAYDARLLNTADSMVKFLPTQSPLERQKRTRDQVIRVAKDQRGVLRNMIVVAGEGYVEIGKNREEAKKFIKGIFEKVVAVIPIDVVEQAAPAG